MEYPKIKYTRTIIDLAEKNAIEMMTKGESLRRIQFGQKSGFFYLSDDPLVLISDRTINVGGKDFYIGIYKKP